MNSEKKLETLNNEVNKIWLEIVDNNKERAFLLEKKLNFLSNSDKKKSLDSLLKLNYYPLKCDKEYLYLQSKINDSFLEIMSINDSTDIDTEKNDFANEISEIDSVVNKLITSYNEKAKFFNKKASSFPNIIISRRKHYERKTLFRHKYGEYSNIKEKDNQALEWMLKMKQEKGL